MKKKQAHAKQQIVWGWRGAAYVMGLLQINKNKLEYQPRPGQISYTWVVNKFKLYYHIDDVMMLKAEKEKKQRMSHQQHQ